MNIIEKMATKLHEDWKKTNVLLPSRKYESKWVVTHDKDFIDILIPTHLPSFYRYKNGQYEVDVANCSFDDLNAEVSNEYIKRAKACYKLLVNEPKNPKEIITLLYNDLCNKNTKLDEELKKKLLRTYIVCKEVYEYDKITNANLDEELGR